VGIRRSLGRGAAMDTCQRTALGRFPIDEHRCVVIGKARAVVGKIGGGMRGRRAQVGSVATWGQRIMLAGVIR
jgi:hypothetical protein